MKIIENQPKKMRKVEEEIHFNSTIEINVGGSHTPSEILDTLKTFDTYNISYFPNGYFLSKEIIEKINISPIIKNGDMDEVNISDNHLPIEHIREDIMTLQCGIYYPKYNPKGEEYTEYQIECFETVYRTTEEIEICKEEMK